MADIFISYATEDRERAREIAAALMARGYSVWWDRKIPIGRSYTDVIEQELTLAKCVMVLWSKESVQSPWVHNEAREGYSRHVLVPVLIEDVRPPLEFRHLQTASLIDWEPDGESVEFTAVLSALTTLRSGTAYTTGSRGGSVPVPEAAFAPARRRNFRLPMITGLAVLLLAVVGFIMWNSFDVEQVQPDTASTSTEATAASTEGTDVSTEGTAVSTDGTATTPGGTSTSPPIRPKPDASLTALLSGVGQVLVDGNPTCTAFLVSKTRALMPAPCISAINRNAPLVLRLGQGSRFKSYKLRILVAEEDDSFLLVQLDGAADAAFAPLKIRARQAKVGEEIVIAHHGHRFFLSVDRVRVRKVRPDGILYEAATEGGSMGAPVVATSDRAVVGIHYGRDDTSRTLKRAVPSTSLPASILRQIR